MRTITSPFCGFPLILELFFSSYISFFTSNSATGINLVPVLFSTFTPHFISYLLLRYHLWAPDLQVNTYLTSPCAYHKTTSTQHDQNRHLGLPYLTGPFPLFFNSVMATTSVWLYKSKTREKLVSLPPHPTSHQISDFCLLLSHRCTHFSPTLPQLYLSLLRSTLLQSVLHSAFIVYIYIFLNVNLL